MRPARRDGGGTPPNTDWRQTMGTKRSIRKRIALLAIGLVALALTATNSLAAPSKKRSPKPTVVLVHGAFADASTWNSVIARLQHDGYPVIAPANPLRGI